MGADATVERPVDHVVQSEHPSCLARVLATTAVPAATAYGMGEWMDRAPTVLAVAAVSAVVAMMGWVRAAVAVVRAASGGFSGAAARHGDTRLSMAWQATGGAHGEAGPVVQKGAGRRLR